MSEQFGSPTPGPGEWALLLSAQVLLLYSVLGSHEGGHLLGGWPVEFRFQQFTIGSWQIRRLRLRVRIDLNPHRPWYGGGVVCSTGGERNSRLRAEAAVLLAEGKPEDARISVEQGLVELARATVSVVAHTEAEWLRELASPLADRQDPLPPTPAAD
jgi:hypothetical protein